MLVRGKNQMLKKQGKTVVHQERINSVKKKQGGGKKKTSGGKGGKGKISKKKMRTLKKEIEVHCSIRRREEERWETPLRRVKRGRKGL